MKKLFVLSFALLFVLFITGVKSVAADVSRWRAPVVDVYISKDYADYSLMYKAFNEWCWASDRRFLFNLSSTKGMAKNGHVKVYFDREDSDSIVETSRPGLNYPEVRININTKDADGTSYSQKLMYSKMLHYAGLAMGLEKSENSKSVLYPSPTEEQSILKEDVLSLFSLYGWKVPKTFRYFR
ncbi:hypothetical protein J6E39_03035 [bacterium]|nr:hypothetical protein [bacterium]